MALGSDQVATEQPKKRRRRVPTSGASEDCSGCRKLRIQCDRRRPYCSQCLETSKDCPGYRTTLTWGVGVASRGRLRGLSIPLANSAPCAPADGHDTTPQSAPQTRPRPKTSQVDYSGTIVETLRKRVRRTPLQTDTHQHQHQHQPPPHLSASALPFTNPFQPPQHHQHHGQEWQHSAAYHAPSFSTSPDMMHRPRDIFPLHTAVGTTFQNIPWSPSSHHQNSSVASTAASDSPNSSYPRTPSTTQSFEPYFPALAAASAAPSAMPAPTSRPSFGWPNPNAEPCTPESLRMDLRRDVSTPSELSHGRRQTFDVGSDSSDALVLSHSHEDFRPNLHRAYSAPQAFHFGDHDAADSSSLQEDGPVQDVVQTSSHASAVDDWFSAMPLAPSSAFFQLHPRMQYLLDYYDKAICPVLVASDGPTNPYRHFVVNLAMSSVGLQSAIAALATNNLRMRRLKEIPRSSVDGPPDRDMIKAIIGTPDAEEQHYKATAIKYLNSQLSDPLKAREDSVLATLLILCLFHVCDSGFSKFKTQLAGVQKLLKMRSSFRQSDFVAWVELFFAWFDVMTSAVNDRETLLHGGSMDILNLSKSLRDVESVSGCDGHLFKLIARLSRLNLLSQSRPVRDLSEQRDAAGAKPVPAYDYYSLPRDSLEVNDFYSGDLNPRGGSPPLLATSPTMGSDGRREFWSEWHNVHDRLTAWQYAPTDGPVLDADDAVNPGQGRQGLDARARQDTRHMSEAFRSAALLYLERLAAPAAPCAAPQLQEHVEVTLAHAHAIADGSCMTKFLLWPLFVAGTEAVAAPQRALVRARAEQILRESGFYNNVAGLDVLERIWAEGRDVGHPPGEQAFRWRKCMERVDGEYIVI